MTETKTPARRGKARDESPEQWTEDELAAMKEHARELNAAKARGGRKGDGEADLLAKIAEMSGSVRAMAERIHAIVKAAAPEVESRTWYGMPAYAKDGKVICFFQPADKFKSRYSTIGFNDGAKLDDGNMWPTSFALMKLTPDDEQRIAELVKKAVS